MAEVSITIKDLHNGKVGVVADPNLKALAQRVMLKPDRRMSPAETLAVLVLKTIKTQFSRAEKLSRSGILPG